jgi:hypothetical protein
MLGNEPLGEDKMLDLLPAEMARLVFDECGDDVERSPKMFDECVAYLDKIWRNAGMNSQRWIFSIK